MLYSSLNASTAPTVSSRTRTREAPSSSSPARLMIGSKKEVMASICVNVQSTRSAAVSIVRPCLEPECDSSIGPDKVTWLPAGTELVDVGNDCPKAGAAGEQEV